MPFNHFPVIVLLQAVCHEISSGIWVLFNSRSAFGSYLVCHHLVFLLIWRPFSNYFCFWSGCSKSASTVTRAALHFGKYHTIFNSCSCFLSFLLILLWNLFALFFFFNSSHCTAFICLSTQVIFFIVDIVCRCSPFQSQQCTLRQYTRSPVCLVFLFTVLTVQQPVSNSWSALKQREVSISRTAAPVAVSSTLVILLFYNSCKRYAGLQGSSGDR